MNPDAIIKANDRLDRAGAALEAIRNSTTIRELRTAWRDYVLAHSNIFTTLEKGAKDNARSRQWYGAKRKFRAKDPLLNYLHQSRNADEHEIPFTVERRMAGGITFPENPAGPGRMIAAVSFKPAGGKEIELGRDDENGLSSVTLLRPVFLLLKVYNSRTKRYYDPPKEHLGKPLENPRPIGVADAGLAYVTNLVGKAARFSP